jgi:hypothetical protein
MKMSLILALVITGCASAPPHTPPRTPPKVLQPSTRLVPAPPVPGGAPTFRAAAAPTAEARFVAASVVAVKVPPPDTYHQPEIIGEMPRSAFILELKLSRTNASTMSVMVATNLSTTWDPVITFPADTNGVTIVDTDFMFNPSRFFYLRPEL